ncbi:hypothetical protein AGMMS49982_17660 [Bacteroidia bacterium]|nr:hypothetical protein AGMMS49982_17660 [Bacteroidia bacterium]
MENEKIHIGKLIRDRLKVDRRSAAWLADELHCNRSNIYRIIQTYHIDTEQLASISKILDYDFFAHYSASFQSNKESTAL